MNYVTVSILIECLKKMLKNGEISKDDKIVDAFIHADGVQTTMFDKDIPDGALYFKIRPEEESDYDTAVSFFCRNNEGGDEK